MVENREEPERTGAPVSRFGRAKQASEIRARWAWAEPAIWTNRMLSALETGVKGGIWFEWPNRYFAELGLYSLEQAQADARQSFR